MKYNQLNRLACFILILTLITGCSKKQDYSSTKPGSSTNNNNGNNGLTLTSNSPVPTGSTLNLTASSISGATYYWSGPASFYSAVQNPSVSNFTSADAGTYTCTATTGGGYYGGQSYTATITVSAK